MNLNEIRQRLESNITAGRPLLTGTPIDSAAYHADIGTILDVGRFKLTGTTVAADDRYVRVQGHGQLLHFANISIDAGFENVGGDLFFTLEAGVEGVAAFGVMEHFGSPLKETVVSWRFGPLLGRSDPGWIPTMSLAAFRALLEVPGIEPVVVRVYPPAAEGETQWSLQGDFPPVILPSLDQLLRWLGGLKTADLFPAQLTALGGLSLLALDLCFDPAVPMVSSVSLTIGTEKSWSPGVGKLRFDKLLLSLVYCHTDGDHAALSARVTGELAISTQLRVAFSLTHDSATGLSTVEVASENGRTLPGLGELGELIGAGDLVAHLPDVLKKVKAVLVRSLRVAFDSKAGRLGSAALGIEITDPIPLEGTRAHLEGIDLQLEVKPAAHPPIQGDLNALMVAGSLMLPVHANITEQLVITAHLQSIDPRQLFTDLPDAFPKVVLLDVRVQLTTSGVLEFSAAIDLNFHATLRAFQVPLPESMAAVSLSSFAASLNLANGSWSMTAVSDTAIRLIDSNAGRLVVSGPQITMTGGQGGGGFSSTFQLGGFMKPDPNVMLDFPRVDCAIETGSGKWYVDTGQTILQLFGHRYTGFSCELGNDKISLAYGGDQKIVLVNWEGVGTVDVSRFTVFVHKSNTAVAGDAQSPQSNGWHFDVSGQAKVAVAGLIFPELQLSVSDQKLQAIVEHPQFPPIVIDKWPAPAPRAQLGFEQMVLAYETGAENGTCWRLDAKNGSMSFRHIPAMVQDYFRDLPRQCDLHIGDDGAWVQGAVGVDIPFPHLSFRIGKTTSIDLGQPIVRLESVGIGLTRSPFLSADLTVGLPKQPQWLADLLNDHCGFELKIAKSLQLAVTSSPFKAISDGKQRKDKPGRWWYAQLQDAGKYWIRVPEFAYSGQTWDLLVAVDRMGEASLPLAPVKALLKALGIPPHCLDFLPKSLPLRGLDLSHLDTLYEQVQRLLGDKMPEGFKSVIRKALEAIEKGLALMPDDFHDYLAPSVPESFSLRMGVDPKGGATIGLETQGDPFRLLIPSMISTIPELVGIELKAFSMGSAAGGLLSIVSVDGHLDRFDLLTIVDILAVQDKKWSRSLRNRLHLEQVLAVIPNEFPIPIMITYDHIGWDFKSWLGIGIHTHFYFPQVPQVMWNWISTAIPFFSNPDYHLHSEKHPPLAGDFTIGENYLTLPKYLGADPGKAYGLDHRLPPLDVDQSLSFILDGLKFVNPGYIIQSVPLLNKPGHTPQLLPIRIHRSHIEFGPLRYDVAWCITTQEEFKRVRHLPAVVDALKAANDPDVLQSLPEAAHGPDYDKGFVLLFSEETAIEPIVDVKAQFGMALTGGGGFETGMQLKGTIAGSLALTLRGHIKGSRPPDTAVLVHGTVSLKWGKDDLIAAVDVTVIVTAYSFELNDISLKLHNTDCLLAGQLIIDVRKGVKMGGHFRWTYADSQPAIDLWATANFSNRGIELVVSETDHAGMFGYPVKKLLAYLYPGEKQKGATIEFDTGPLNKLFSGEFEKLASTLEDEVRSLWQRYQQIFQDFAGIFTDVETIREKLPPALASICKTAPGEIHKRVDQKIDQYWPKLAPGKEAVKKEARKYADKKAKGPLANLSTLRSRLPKANTDQLKQELLDFINRALAMKTIAIDLGDISIVLRGKTFDIKILQEQQLTMLGEAKRKIPKIPEKRKDSDTAWKNHYLRSKLQKFVDEIAQSIHQGLPTPRLVGLSAGIELAKNAPTQVNAQVVVVYKDPQKPFEKSITVDLKHLLQALPAIAREFAIGTEPTPPQPPPPPEPGEELPVSRDAINPSMGA